jgi:hypothetical protein
MAKLLRIVCEACQGHGKRLVARAAVAEGGVAGTALERVPCSACKGLGRIPIAVTGPADPDPDPGPGG